jgi:hypothetical protein
MHINWSGVGEVFMVALAVGVGVVVLFTLGIVALGRRSAAVEQRGPTFASSAAAGLCFLACAVTIGYGLYVIVAS